MVRRDAYNSAVLTNFVHEEPWNLYSLIFGPYTVQKKVILPDRPYNPIQPVGYSGPTSFTTYGINGGWGAPTEGEVTIANGKIGKSFGVLGFGNALKDSGNADILSSGTRLGASPTTSCRSRYMVVLAAPTTKTSSQGAKTLKIKA